MPEHITIMIEPPISKDNPRYVKQNFSNRLGGKKFKEETVNDMQNKYTEDGFDVYRVVAGMFMQISLIPACQIGIVCGCRTTDLGLKPVLTN